MRITETMYLMSTWVRVEAYEEPPLHKLVHILWNSGAWTVGQVPAETAIEPGPVERAGERLGEIIDVHLVRRVTVCVLWNSGERTLMLKQLDSTPEELGSMAKLALWWGTLQEPLRG